MRMMTTYMTMTAVADIITTMTAGAADIITPMTAGADIITTMTAVAAAIHNSTRTAGWMPLKRKMTMCTLHRDS